MRKFPQLVLSAAATLLAFSTLFPARADTLMVISDSGGMFGDKSLNQAMEHFGAGLAISAMKKNYRRVVDWYAADQGPEDDYIERILWARSVIDSQQPGEKIDVFAMQHSGESFLNLGRQKTGEKLFPPGMIRRVFSSGCSNWGDFTAKADGTNLAVERSSSDFSGHMKRLGVEEYVIHANMNGTGPFSYPLLASEMGIGGSWLEAGKRAFDKADLIAAEEYFKIKKLDGILNRISNVLRLPFRSSILEGFMAFFGSRPVFGGSKLEEKRPVFEGRNMFSVLSDPAYAQTEAMLAPINVLSQIFIKDLPAVFNGHEYFVNSEKLQADFSKDPGSLSEGVMGVADLLKQILGEVARTPREDLVCVDPKPFQAFLDAYAITEDGKIPQFEKVCMEKVSAKEYTLSWKLSAPNGIHFPGFGVWLVKVPASNDTYGTGVKLKTVYLRRHGSVTLLTEDDRTGFVLKGLGVRAEGPRLSEYFKVPNGVMRFTVRSASMTEKGEFAAKLGTVLGPIVGIEGRLKESSAEVNTLRVLGIPFKIAM
ncbi:hypothetical protein WDW86_18560 [Bdellovibrionota bacterium FG-2]